MMRRPLADIPCSHAILLCSTPPFRVPADPRPVNAKSQPRQIHERPAVCYYAGSMLGEHTASYTTTATPIRTAMTPGQAAVIFGQHTDCCILESTLPGNTYARYSVFAVDPVEVVEIPFDPLSDPLAALPARLGMDRPGVLSGSAIPFTGGWFGYLSYEAGLGTERLSPSTAWPGDVPVIRLGLFDAVAIFDHARSQWFAAAVDLSPTRRDARPVRKRLETIRGLLQTSENVPIDVFSTPVAAEPTPRFTRQEYLDSAQRAKRYIEAGDIYQVNLTQRWSMRTTKPALHTYMRLRRESPAPHAAFLQFGDRAVLSASPELFLRLHHGHVITRPIKGTRPRIGDPQVDRAALAALTASDKDRAELNMIIDLLRNDLGRVSRLGSVRVVDADCIETHPTVYHRVATVQGDLDVGRNWFDLLRAAFPGGSITGAPKIRAMQIIDELEPVARGPYCGAIGWIGLDGSMALNVAIRTMTQLGDEVHVYAGGAIVADSDPKSEYDETLVKAAAMFRALGCRAPAFMNPTVREEVAAP